MYLVSACLAGFNTRYDGTNSLNEKVRAMVLEGIAIPVCPEQLGGLATPRPPVEFAEGDGMGVLDGTGKAVTVESGQDLTASFLRGAWECLRIARLYGAKAAILKEGSPSCGVTRVHSGGGKAGGMGVAAALLAREGIKLISDDSI